MRTDPTYGLHPYVVLIRRGRPRRMEYETMYVLAGSSPAARHTAELRLGKRDAIVSVRRREDP